MWMLLSRPCSLLEGELSGSSASHLAWCRRSWQIVLLWQQSACTSTPRLTSTVALHPHRQWLSATDCCCGAREGRQSSPVRALSSNCDSYDAIGRSIGPLLPQCLICGQVGVGAAMMCSGLRQLPVNDTAVAGLQ